MKSVIVYYSATGSTAKIARAIHRGMKETMETCDIIPVKKANPGDMQGYDLIVIGGPVWHCRDTVNLRQFIYNMPVMEGKMCAMFCCHGALPVGFFAQVASVLKTKRMSIIGWEDWFVDVKQVLHMPYPYPTSGHPDDIDLKEAEDFGREIAARAARIAAGEKGLIPELPKRGSNGEDLWSLRIFSKSQAGLPDMFSKIPNKRTINVSKCSYPECTACIDNCIVNCFDFSINPPVQKSGCIGCDICDKICPRGAIEIDEMTASIRSKKRIDMSKCRYPACTICVDNCPMNSIDFSVTPPVFTSNCEADDLCWAICPTGAIEITNMDECQRWMGMTGTGHRFLKILDDYAARGKFRKLIKDEEIGFGSTLMDSPDIPRLKLDKQE
jgi:flavodoxin/NAD-dependent dihydropyrimidine dehydrogenase PreA subunit